VTKLLCFRRSLVGRDQQPNSRSTRATLAIERPLALRMPSCVARSAARVELQKNGRSRIENDLCQLRGQRYMPMLDPPLVFVPVPEPVFVPEPDVVFRSILP
jgi:hypothetical protein